ncbi:Anaerobic magnesium-protoporphyrin IX monomethyl ester cyclase [Halioglobus japonicus]|nr:Anaerobic magnesium-protoporphyrin IX monomethyl ester cyclase [Halioglobus japonicus]
MQRPIWLLSLDSDTFPAAPMTTGGLKAYYQELGKNPAQMDIQLVHFVNHPEKIPQWLEQWQKDELPRAKAAVAEGLEPVMGFSVYTWNAAEFLDLMRQVKALCPELLIVAGGPHVQKAHDYLFSEAVDIVVLGEGEATFTDFLDAGSREAWHDVAGLAFVENGELVTTAERPRFRNLNELPSPLNVISLLDSEGEPYDCIAYETSRGCPYKCAFCEWGTGAIGTKMLSFSVERIRHDWNYIVDAGIKNIWLTDSNFGALKEDVEKAKVLCEIKQRTGLPNTFATSWSKKHGSRSQEIVLLLHQNNLLPHYHLALQTLTPLALELCHRTNMDANKYEPIAREMAKARVPIACELIWGLVGDNLASFEKNLDRLFAVFPTINIFGYTLLPGTEFYDKREEYSIETLPVAGYGKAKGEYVVGCMSFPIEEGLEGYFLITAHLLMSRGYMLPLTLRYLALSETVPVAGMMRALLHALCTEFSAEIPGLNADDKMGVYEFREELFITSYTYPERTYACVEKIALQWIDDHMGNQLDAAGLKHRVLQLLALDRAFAPHVGATREVVTQFDFDANAVIDTLESMEIPAPELFADNPTEVGIHIPGGVGDIIKDPDGGVWIHAERTSSKEEHAAKLQPVTVQALAVSA